MEGKGVSVPVVTADWGHQLTMTSQERLDLIQLIRFATGRCATCLNDRERRTATKTLDALGVLP